MRAKPLPLPLAWLVGLCCLVSSLGVIAHPLRLSLCEIEYSSAEELLSISLRLFVMDVNEALVFDPNSTALGLGEPHEAAEAETLLLDYLKRFFEIRVNGQKVELQIKSKRLKGEGDNMALAVLFEYEHAPPLASLDIKNAVFTDLFFDQNNIVYVHVDDVSKSLMLSKKTPAHVLTF
ncbi:MAG: DUF6702 family protein [Pseudomonadota bacterium]